MSLFSRAALLKFLDSSVGWALCKCVGRLRHMARRPSLAPTPQPADIRSLLILRPGGMGDMLMLLPVIRGLREALPHARIDIVCEKRNRDVLHLAGLEDTALLYDTHPLALLRRLRDTAYDVVLDTEQFHNFSAILSWLSGARVRIGFKINPARLHLYTHLVGYDVDGYEMDQFVRLVQTLGISLPVSGLHGSLAEVAIPGKIPAHLEQIAAGRRLVAVCPGAGDPYKQWGGDRFAPLIDGLVEFGEAVVLLGGRDDRASAQGILARLGNAAFVSDCTGRCTLVETAAILKRAALLIGGDSGLTHLAGSLGVRTLVLFGPSDPGKWAAPDEHHVVIRKPLPCSPCAIFGYRKWCRDIPCMRSISVDEVMHAATSMLDK